MKHENSYKHGFLSISVCLLILNLVIVAGTVQSLYQARIHHYKNKLSYISAYATALSGIRVSKTLWENIPDISEQTLSTERLLNTPIINWKTLSFQLIKTASSVYSIAKKNDSLCIIKAVYTPTESGIKYLAQELYYASQ